MSISNETTKKIGLFTSLCMLVGSVVGVGIFLKNDGVFKTNEYNSIGILISWILGAVIAFSTAYCFAEIGSSQHSRSGISGWAEKLLGKKIGYFIKVIFPIFYLSLMEVILSMYMSETIFQLFPGTIENLHFGYIALLTLGLMFFFIIFNYFSLKISGIFSSATTILKFIPIIFIIILGIVIASIEGAIGIFSNENAENIANTNNISYSSSPSFSLIISCLPSILFAFDSFTNVGNLALDIKKPEKNVSLSIVIGMLLCSIFYLLITISQILLMQGNALALFSGNTEYVNKYFNQQSRNVLTVIIKVFILISISGVVNSFSASTIRSCNSLIDEKVIFCYRFFESISNRIPLKDKDGLRPGLILLFTITLIWYLAFMIPSIVVSKNGTDAFLDGISNFPTLFFFFIYGMLVLGALINRFTKKVQTTKSKLLFVLGPISIIGILLVFGYQFFYQFLTRPFVETNMTYGWGLFYTNNYQTQGYVGTIFFFLAIALFISIPLINYGLSYLLNKKKNIEYVIDFSNKR